MKVERILCAMSSDSARHKGAWAWGILEAVKRDRGDAAVC